MNIHIQLVSSTGERLSTAEFSYSDYIRLKPEGTDMFNEILTEMLKEVSTQDPAIDITTNPKGTNVWKELYDRYKLTEGYKLTKLIDDLNVIDTRDEIDTKEEIKKGDIDFMYKWIREKSGK